MCFKNVRNLWSKLHLFNIYWNFTTSAIMSASESTQNKLFKYCPNGTRIYCYPPSSRDVSMSHQRDEWDGNFVLFLVLENNHDVVTLGVLQISPGFFQYVL